MSSQIDAMQKDSKNMRNNIIVIVLAVVLAVVLVLFFMQRRDHKVIMNEITAEKDSIQYQLTEIAASYDSLKTENDTISEQLFVAQNKVKDLLIEVEQTKSKLLENIGLPETGNNFAWHYARFCGAN